MNKAWVCPQRASGIKGAEGRDMKETKKKSINTVDP